MSINQNRGKQTLRPARRVNMKVSPLIYMVLVTAFQCSNRREAKARALMMICSVGDRNNSLSINVPQSATRISGLHRKASLLTLISSKLDLHPSFAWSRVSNQSPPKVSQSLHHHHHHQSILSKTWRSLLYVMELIARHLNFCQRALQVSKGHLKALEVA